MGDCTLADDDFGGMARRHCSLYCSGRFARYVAGALQSILFESLLALAGGAWAFLMRRRVVGLVFVL